MSVSLVGRQALSETGSSPSSRALLPAEACDSVAIAGSGLILIRLTVDYILFRAAIFLFLARRNKAVWSSHPTPHVVVYFICAGYTPMLSTQEKH